MDISNNWVDINFSRILFLAWSLCIPFSVILISLKCLIKTQVEIDERVQSLVGRLVNIVLKVSEDGRVKLMLFWGYTGWEFDSKSVRVTWSR